MKRLITKLGIRLSHAVDLADLVFLAAVASVAYGIALIHKPAAFIVVGLLFVILTTRDKPGDS